MLPDQVSNPGPLAYESGALPIALRGPAMLLLIQNFSKQKETRDSYDQCHTVQMDNLNYSIH